MKFKAYTGITWSLLELTGLLEDTDSRVCFEKVKKHLGLHPFHLTNIHTALNEILSSNLNSYDPELKGFLLAYKNPKLLTSLGEIFYDTCFIHIDVEADFYIFRPKVGCCLKGVVNKKGLNHIGLLVHKAFNVSVPRPDCEDDWPGDTVEMGQEVRVHVTHLDYTSRLPFIRGILDKEDYLEGCRLPLDSLENKRLSICEYNESEEVSSNQETSKKNKPRPFFTSDSEQSSEEEVETPVKRKQAKKEKQLIKNDSLSQQIEVEEKKSKKSKKVKSESKIDIPEEEVVNNICTDNDNNYESERIHEEVSTKKSKSKSTKKSMELVVNNTVPKLKKERVRTSSSSDNVLDEETYIRKIKKEKSSNVEKQSNISDAGASAQDSEAYSKSASTKISKKKTKLSKVESEDVEIKDEQLVATEEPAGHKKKRKKNKHNETKEETVETQPDIDEEKLGAQSHSLDNPDVSMNEDTDLVPKKKKSKKQKKLQQDEDINTTSRKEIVKSEVTNSTVIDGEREIPTTNIKTERLGSYDSTTEKKSKPKGLPEPATITQPSIMKIKKERSVSVSGSENATEDEKSPRKVKSEKRSKSKKQYDADDDINPERSMKSPDKRIPKKMKMSESETESTTVPIKRETLNNVTHSENSDASQTNAQSSPKKKKSKRQKCREEENEAENNAYQNHTIKSEFMNSSGFSMTSEIPVIDIKQEKIQSADEMNENECSLRSITCSATNLEESAVSTENSSKKKKKKKNKDKDLSNDEILDASFEVRIKTEKPDSSFIIVKNEVKETPTKEKHVEEIEITGSEEEGDSESKKRNSKKVKTADASLLNNVDNEVELPSNEDWKKKAGRKTSKSSHENTNSLDYSNTKIKVEKDR